MGETQNGPKLLDGPPVSLSSCHSPLACMSKTHPLPITCAAGQIRVQVSINVQSRATILPSGVFPCLRLGRSLALPRMNGIDGEPEFLAILKVGAEIYP